MNALDAPDLLNAIERDAGALHLRATTHDIVRTERTADDLMLALRVMKETIDQVYRKIAG